MKHGGVKWIHGKPSDVEDFSVNLNPLGVPDFINQLIHEAIRSKVYEYYPDNYDSLKENIAEIYNVDQDYIGVFNGATEAIKLLNPLVVEEPNFLEYPRKWIYFARQEKNKFVYSLQGDELIISNPNNPTGSRIELKEIKEFLESGRFLVIDESFTDISDVESSLSFVKDYDNLLIISTFTKSFSVPGLRLGFTIGRKSKELERKAIPWRVNSIAYYVFSNVNAKEVRSFLSKSREYVKKLRTDFVKKLNSSKLIDTIYESFAPYILVKFKKPVTSINESLRNYKIRECQNYIGLDGFYGRIAVKPNYDELLEVFNRIL